MWLCIPEGKPIWQVKSLQRGSQYQSNGRNKTIPTRVKDMAESNLIGRKTLIGRILKLEKGLLKIAFNLAVILYILRWRWGQFVAVSECHKQEQINTDHLVSNIILYIFKIKLCISFVSRRRHIHLVFHQTFPSILILPFLLLHSLIMSLYVPGGNS